MRCDFKGVFLGLRLQYYLPFVLISGYLLWYPTPKKVQADQGINSLPILKDSDPSTWPQPQALPPTDENSAPLEPLPKEATPNLPSEIQSILTDENNASGFSPSVSPSSINGGAVPEPKRSGEDRSPSLNINPPDPIPVFLPTSPSKDGNTQQAVLEPERSVEDVNIPSIISPYQPDEYRLSIGDTISVFVANIPEFTTENIIRSDGSINLPIAGKIFLWDMTVEDAERAITKHYVDAQVLRDPDISVKLLASSPLTIAIAGEINRPGAYDIPVLDKRLPTITDIIKFAGGIASEADLRNIELYRHNRMGGQTLKKLNLMALYKEADLSQNITLRSGDRIIIPTSPVRSDESKLIGSANISPDSMQIGILGEVLSPGIIQSPTNTGLNQALILVGGFNSRAKKTVQLVRTNDDGSVTRQSIKIDWAASVGDEQNPILQHRDVILVGPNAIAKYSDFLDKALGPINRTVPFIGILDLIFPSNK